MTTRSTRSAEAVGKDADGAGTVELKQHIGDGGGNSAEVLGCRSNAAIATSQTLGKCGWRNQFAGGQPRQRKGNERKPPFERNYWRYWKELRNSSQTTGGEETGSEAEGEGTDGVSLLTKLKLLLTVAEKKK